MSNLCLALLCGIAAAAPLSWPLDMASRYLTGNFMEPRDGRYHAGLDLKTGSRTGLPVVAVCDGHLSRIRMSAAGYGQAVYLTAPDGRTYVYGHLERLRDDWRAAVQTRQRQQGSYEVDCWFQPHEWPVRRGEVLALSGQSATAGPHLHFEVRGGDGQPLDPLAHGFAVTDTIAPEILAVRAVTVETADSFSWLYGDGQAPLRGRLPQLRLGTEPLFFRALIAERSDQQGHRLGPWRIRLLVDGIEVYAAVNDSLRWDNSQHQRLEYSRTPLGQELWLRIDARNRLAGRRAAPWLSEGRWPHGRHDLELQAEDRAGNRTTVAWTLVIADSPAGSAGDPPGWPRDPVGWPEPWLVDWDSEDLATGQVPASALVWAAAPLREPVGPRFWRLTGLQRLGRPVQYRLEGDWALLEPVAVVLPPQALPPEIAANDPTVGVYRLRRQGWAYETPLSAWPDGIGCEMRQTGVFKVLRDVQAPVIATAGVPAALTRQPLRQRAGITLPVWPLLKIPVGDHGSGVDWSNLTVSLDGEPLIVEPDPPRDRILVELPADLAAGPCRLEITVCDRAGHRTRAALDLTLSEQTAAGAGF